LACTAALLVYQHLVVVDGSASASNTSCGGRRIIPTFTDGALVSCGIILVVTSVPGSVIGLPSATHCCDV
jgi:hypothetical protein